MPIYVISTIKQKNAAIFPLIEDTDLLGGFRTVPDITTRDGIPASYRKAGMFVWTEADAKLWRLNVDLVSWTEITFGGGGAGDALTDTRTSGATITAGAPVSLNGAGNLILADADGQFEVYGLAVGGGGVGVPIDVITHGVATVPDVLTIGDIYYLGVGGGIINVPPSLDGVPAGSRSIVRIGQARTTSTLLVRVQHIAAS